MMKKEKKPFEELKLILADIDGTLVNEPREMMPYTREVIKYLHDKKGVLFGIASGRPGDELSATIAGYDLGFEPEFLIGMNGGEIIDTKTNQETVCYPLEPETIKEILELMQDFTYANPVIYQNHQLVCAWIDELVETSCQHASKKARVVKDRSEYWDKPTGKIMLRTPAAELCVEMEEFAKKHPSTKYTAFRTQPTLLEFQDPRANKGAALMSLSSQYNIPVQTIAAFGDASNDNEMLAESGLGVCMINGLDDTKACADELTKHDNNCDGMVRYIVDRFPELFDEFNVKAPELPAQSIEREEWI